MDDVTLRKVQLVQLEIAKEIKAICERNNIEFFLESGTLLGAVRHGGFIPWDDDLDLGMTRSNYNKFIECASKELDNKYFLQTVDTDENYPLAFCKIRKNNTIYMEKAHEHTSFHNGIFVDVFPYDNIPDDDKIFKKIKKRLKFAKRIMLMKCNSTPWTTYQGRRKIFAILGYLPIRVIAFFMSKQRIILCYSSTYNRIWEKTYEKRMA